MSNQRKVWIFQQSLYSLFVIPYLFDDLFLFPKGGDAYTALDYKTFRQHGICRDWIG
jgi:hypothetical protein